MIVNWKTVAEILCDSGIGVMECEHHTPECSVDLDYRSDDRAVVMFGTLHSREDSPSRARAALKSAGYRVRARGGELVVSRA